jgi:hypothetical protein
LRESLDLEDFSENRSVLFPSTLDTIAEERFANDSCGHTVYLYEDNQAVVTIIKNRTSSSPLLMNELCLLMALLEQYRLQYVFNVSNLLTRIGSV